MSVALLPEPPRRKGRTGSSAPRPDDDHYPTERRAVVPLLRWLGYASGHETRAIWEPAAGDGAMARVLAETGVPVVSTTLKDYGWGETGVDFLATTALRAPIVITNPPYRQALAFARHALDLGAAVLALLLRTRFLEGRERQRALFQPDPPVAVLQFVDRLRVRTGDRSWDGWATQPGMTNEAFAWFVWRQPNWRIRPEVFWIESDAGPLVRKGDRRGDAAVGALA